MSSSSVCQGLQSCLEPRVMEPKPRVLRIKLALQQGSKFSQPSPTSNTNIVSHLSDTDEENDTKSNVGSGWNFLQTLSHKKTEDQVYIHPTVKRLSSVLSEKSLEMCTESLGCETGSNASESSDDMSLFSSDTTITCSNTTITTTTATATTTINTTLASCESKRTNRTCNFPPPLTSITNLGGVHVVPHREGGRLILEAIASPAPRPYFHADRSNGRLRLCLVESFSTSNDDEVGNCEEEEEKAGEESEENIEEKETCGEECDDGAEEELEECVENVEDELGVKKFARPSRCIESRKRDIFCDGLANLSFPLFLSVSE